MSKKIKVPLPEEIDELRYRQLKPVIPPAGHPIEETEYWQLGDDIVGSVIKDARPDGTGRFGFVVQHRVEGTFKTFDYQGNVGTPKQSQHKLHRAMKLEYRRARK